jgi:hypothetical protein
MSHYLNISPHINYNLALPNEHVPEAERNIRVIKERIRATFHSLPFKAIPAVFIKELASESAKKQLKLFHTGKWYLGVLQPTRDYE